MQSVSVLFDTLVTNLNVLQMPEVSCINYSTRCPVGVAGIIAPWNLPLYLLSFKVHQDKTVTYMLCLEVYTKL